MTTDAARAPNVYKAMSLVPDPVRAMAALSRAEYVGTEMVADVSRTPPGARYRELRTPVAGW